MAILMTGLCEKGVELIWKQCNEELYPQGIEYLEENSTMKRVTEFLGPAGEIAGTVLSKFW